MDERRLADVRCDGAGRRKAGTGYLIAPQLVLTAKHVTINDAGEVWSRITVRVGHPRAGTEHRAATVCWTDPEGLDVALLLLDVPVDTPGVVHWGHPVGTAALQYVGLGYPLQTAMDGQRLVEVLNGTLSPLSGGSGPHDLYALDQHSAPRIRTDGRQAWGGASGSAVFCQDFLVAVVLHNDEDHGNRRLHALPARRFATGAAFRTLLETHGVPAPDLRPVEKQPAATQPSAQLAVGDVNLPPKRQVGELVAQAQDEVANRIAQLRERLKFGAVVVLGTGMSLFGQEPTRARLTELLHDAISMDPAAQAAFTAEPELPDQPARLLLPDSSAFEDHAWRAVESSSSARRHFQEEVAKIDRRRSTQPSAAHDALAALIHSGSIECVISLNWDTALESAYSRQYGTGIPSGILFKPRGDAAHPERAYVLPHLPTKLSRDLDRHIHGLADHARTLLLIEGMEQDRKIIEQIISPSGRGWNVCHISAEASGADDIRSAAESSLPDLASVIREREAESAWHTVSFVGSGDIGRALAGERLGPTDVNSCPRLFEVDLLTEGLQRNHAVVLNGESGCGKSITAYQALSDLAKNGYEVLRLRDHARKRGLRQWMADLAFYPHRKALLIDDAQDLSADLVREMAETSNESTLILIVGVDHVAGGVTTYQMSNTAAVGTLAKEVHKRAVEILPIVHQLDDLVGDRLGDESLLARLVEASREDTPWKFFYTLTGGWRRTEQHALELRSRNRADLLLLALAIAQVASVDAGATAEDLEPYAHALGRDRDWIDQGLRILQERRLATINDGFLRCAHLRSAWALIEWMLHPAHVSFPPQVPVVIPSIASAATQAPTAPDPPVRRKERVRAAIPEDQAKADRESASILIRLALDAPNTPLRGAAWLIGRNHSTETRWLLRQHGVLTRLRIQALAERALSTHPGYDIGMSAQLLEGLLSSNSDECLHLAQNHSDTIRDWVVNVSPQNGWAIGDLINTLSTKDRLLTEQILTGIDPQAIARLIPGGGWPHIYSTTHAVDRIAEGGGIELIQRIGASYNPSDFLELAANPPEESGDINHLLRALAYTSRDLGLAIFDQLIPHLAKKVSRNPPLESESIFDTWAFLLGFAPRFLRGRRSPDRQARLLAKKFIRSLDFDRVADSLSHPQMDLSWHNFHSFVTFIREADPASYKAIVTRMSTEEVSAEFEKSLPSPSRYHLYAVNLVFEFSPNDAREILERHEGQYVSADRFLAYMAPEMTIRLLRRGLPIDLGLHLQDWALAASLVNHLAKYDPVVSAELIRANRVGFILGLSSNYTDPFEGLSSWVHACDAHAPRLVDDVVAHLPVGAVSSWARALRMSSRKNEIKPLVHRALDAGGLVAEEARELVVRFPSLKRPE